MTIPMSQPPGVYTQVDQEQNEFKTDPAHVVHRNIWIHKDTVDNQHAGKTTRLRAGLVLVRVEGGGNDGYYVNPEHANAPLEANVLEAVILDEYVETKDSTGTVQNVMARGVQHGFVKTSKLFFGAGTAGSYQTKLKTVMKQVTFE